MAGLILLCLGLVVIVTPLTLSSPLVDATLACNPGAYFDGVKCSLCPGGTYGASPGLTSPQCSGKCAGGYFYPDGSVSARQNLCGRSIYYCPPGSASRRFVGDEYYTVVSPPIDFNANRTDKKNAASEQKMCEPGYFCQLGIRYPCPEGTYGEVFGLMSSACSGSCPKGFFCPLATPHPLSVPCGSVNVFCPLGSMTPTVVSSGFYTTWTPSAGAVPTAQCSGCDGSSHRALEDAYIDGNALAALNQTTRTAQKRCEKGAYCVGGVKRLCPAGVYGASEGLATAACSAPCPAGYFCPIGTSDYLKYPCALKTSFCRQGSANPTPVDSGYSTTLSAPPENLRIDQVICPLGSYCIGGVVYQCPPGTYGGTTGLSTSKCSGRCQSGFICPLGSTLTTQSPCPAGSYSQNGINCSPCAPGYWCAAGSPSRTQNECGSDSSYCPLGSPSALSVLAGQYAVGQQTMTHTSQAFCAIRNVKHLPQCPTRTVGANSGL